VTHFPRVPDIIDVGSRGYSHAHIQLQYRVRYNRDAPHATLHRLRINKNIPYIFSILRDAIANHTPIYCPYFVRELRRHISDIDPRDPDRTNSDWLKTAQNRSNPLKNRSKRSKSLKETAILRVSCESERSKDLRRSKRAVVCHFVGV
jgi:hypothetical protein